MHVLVQRLQHQPVAAKRDEHFGIGGRGVALAIRQALQGFLGFRHIGCHKRNLRELHEFRSVSQLAQNGAPPRQEISK
jgi:hypothetical protein